jgi:hypothetical protein
MRVTSKPAWVIGIAAAIALMASAADARSRESSHHRYEHTAPYAYGPAYDAYRGGNAEEFSGSSVPYDADGPGYNDFQLQGR